MISSHSFRRRGRRPWHMKSFHMPGYPAQAIEYQPTYFFVLGGEINGRSTWLLVTTGRPVDALPAGHDTIRCRRENSCAGCPTIYLSHKHPSVHKLCIFVTNATKQERSTRFRANDRRSPSSGRLCAVRSAVFRKWCFPLGICAWRIIVSTIELS